MSKKLFGKFFIFLLVVGLLFAVAPTGQAQAAAVVTTEAGLREALADPSVTQIELGASFALSATVDVNRSVSIDGKNFTITGPVQGTEIWQGHGLDVTANDVTISNLTITGSGRSNLVFYNVTGGLVTNVTLSNAAHAGMIVNSSTVTINNVTTTKNAWGGINVDQGSGVTETPLLTVTNVTIHTSPTAGVTPAIWVDKGNTAWVAVDDLYTVVTPPNGYLVFYDNTEFATIAASFPIHNETLDIYYATIQDAIDAATSGNTITVNGTHVLTSVVNVNKAVTLTCASDAKIQVSGTGDRFDVSAAATIQNCEIEKTDKSGEQNIIRIRSSNVTISNNHIHGQYVLGDGDVTRAMVINAGAFTGLSITGNEIHNLRQPAYISGTHTGTISANNVYTTRGWVLEGGNLTFTGNTWGDGSHPNAVDIAILNTMPAEYYTNIVAMSDANNNAVIEDQRSTPAVLADVYVDDSVITSGNGTPAAPYKTITEAVPRVAPGGTIHVAAGTYTENVTINKALTLQGAGDERVTVNGVAPTSDAGMLNIVASDVTIDGFKFVGVGNKTVRLNAPSTNVTFSNNTVIGADYDGVGAWDLFTSNYNNAHSNLTITGNVFENNGGQIGVYLNPQVTGLTFTGNTFQGDPTSGPVLGIDGMLGTEVISGNTFDIDSTYALFEGFGTVPIVDIFNANTWPAGYIASGKMVVPASVVYPSTNDINRTNGWAHVDFVSADATAKTITLKFFPNPTLGHFVSCFERRSDGDTSQILTENGGVNYNPLILDGLYPYSCYYGDSGTTYLRTIPVLDYVEIRLPFGAESDERFYWAKFELIDQVWVDDDFTSATPGWGVDHFAVIQDGIDAVAEGGIVNVAAGLYEGPLTIDKQLSLLGPNATINPNTASRNPEAVVVYPSGLTTDADLVTVTADGVLIDGFTIDGKDLGATLWGEGVFAEANNLSVKNNIIKNFMQIGIRIYSNIAGPYYSGALIENNKVISDVAARYFTYSGIYLQGTHGVVRGNVVESAYRGIQIQPYNHPSTELGIVEYNTFSAYKSPIYFNYSVSPTSNWIFRYNIANGIASLETAPVAYFSGIEVQTFQGGNVVFEKNQINLGTANGTINYLYKETGEVGGTSSATPNWWGSALGPQTEVSGIADFSPWCEDADCLTFLPDDDGKVTISGAPFTQTGAIKLYVDGVNYYLPAGTTIRNSSPCFEVYADDIKIYTDYPAAAKCVPTNGSDGIWVADDVQNLRVVNLEFDGTDQETGSGIFFSGDAIGFQVIDNYFHDLDASGVVFTGTPSGSTMDIQGNMFRDLGAAAIVSPAALNAEFNSWGVYAGATLTNVDTEPHTHADFYMEYEGVIPLEKVAVGNTIKYTVYGNLQNISGAQFTLKFPTALLDAGTPVNLSSFVSAGDVPLFVVDETAGTITFNGYAATAVTGLNVPIYEVVFTGTAAGTGAISFDQTNDTFAMFPGYGPSTWVYAAGYVDRTVEVFVDSAAPTLTSWTPAEGNIYLAGGEDFVLTVDALDDNLFSLEIDHNVAALPEFTVYASASNVYGSIEAETQFQAAGVTVTYDEPTQTWVLTFDSEGTALAALLAKKDVTFYAVLHDQAGKTWGSMDPTTDENTFAYSIVFDNTAPTLESWTPAKNVTYMLTPSGDFVVTVDAHDVNLYELEIDHNLASILPEFSVYADATDPYGGDGADFATAGVEVTYDASTQTWVLTFENGGFALDTIIANQGVTFYAVIHDLAGNQWGSMYTVTPDNTFAYTLYQQQPIARADSTGGDVVAVVTADGNTINFTGEVDWYPADPDLGRTSGHRIGVRLSAPELDFGTSDTTFTFNGQTYDWDLVKDGDDYVLVYPKVTAEHQSWVIVVTWGGGFSQTFTVNFDGTLGTVTAYRVDGEISMQGRVARNTEDVITLDGYMLDDFTADSLDKLGINYTLSDVLTGEYIIVTNQPRYLNITADLNKSITLISNRTLPALWLRAGNAVWTDNIIDGLDAGRVGTDWGNTTNPDGNVNFDSIVNIQDLALVGGNFDLTSADAYEAWLP